MASEDRYKLLDILARHPGDGTNGTGTSPLNGQRLTAVRDLAVHSKDANDREVLDRLEEIVLTDEDTAIRVEAVKAIAAIFSQDPQSNKQDLATRLRDLLKSDQGDHEEVCQQVASTLAELRPDGKDVLEALWAKLGATSQPTTRDSIARAILTLDSNRVPDQGPEAENPLLTEAFDKLVSPDPAARRAGVMFLTTNVGWGLLMRSENKCKVQNLLSAFSTVSARDLLMSIVNLIVDVTPGFAELFGLFGIDISPVNSESKLENIVTPEHSSPIVPWKKAIFLTDPRVRNFVNERILKRQVRLALAELTKCFDFDPTSNMTLKQGAELGADMQVKIIDRSPHSSWWQIRKQDGNTAWVETTVKLKITIDGSGQGINEILRLRGQILSLMLTDLQDGDKSVRELMISWLRQCDQYFTPEERTLVASALWDCVEQYGQGLRAYAAIDLRDERKAMPEAVEKIIYSDVDEIVVGGLLLKEAARELDDLYRQPGNHVDYPHKPRIMPFILGALLSPEEQVRQLALFWVDRKASSTEAEDNLPGAFMRDLLARMQDLASDSRYPNVQKAARGALVPITQKQSQYLLRQLEEHDSLAVDVIEELVDMNSPAVMSALIRKWAYWIAETDKSQLVDATALQLRNNKSAVLPLVEQLRDPLHMDHDQEVWLTGKALRQAAPAFADQLIPVLLSAQEIELLRRDEQSKPEPSASKAAAVQVEQSAALLEPWMASLVDAGGKYSELEQTALDKNWKGKKKAEAFAKLFLMTELERRELLARRRIALQLAEMSSPRFFESGEFKDGTRNPTYVSIKSELRTHAVPYLAHKLPDELDLRVREHMARTLANVGELEAVDALALAIVAEDRTKANRQEVLAEYYLEPSRRRSDQAAKILTGAVDDAKRSMRIIQVLSIATFALGVVIVAGGLFLALTGQSGSAEQLFGLFAAIGGIAGIIALLLKGPLYDIQNSIANLVQLETAFTSFIWELNLNSTYVQSQYVQEGVIANDVVAATVGRIESAMSTAMKVIALYTEEGRQEVFAHINALTRGSGAPGTEIKVLGQYLKKVDDDQKKDPKGKIMVAINHIRIDADITSWEKDQVTFKLPAGKLPGLENGTGVIWISLIVDGVETNAVPFEVTKTADSDDSRPEQAPSLDRQEATK